MVLGPILEQSFMVSAIKASWNAASFFERPLALALMATTLVLVFFGLRFGKRLTAAASAKEPAEPSGPQPPPPSP
jgi:TctA family transporter